MIFPLGIPDGIGREEVNKWYVHYQELMEFKRNSKYGKTKCFRCLLSPDREEAAIFLGINKVIARALERKYNIISSSPPIYPCPVLNIFECPYKSKVKLEEEVSGKEVDVDYLFELSEIAYQLELAFATAQSMTYSNDTIYEANFETNRVEPVRDSYSYDWSIPPLDYPLEEKLAEVKRLSVVPIRGARDVYHALTEKETLDKILKQGLDEEENQKSKDQLLSFFISIKENIRMDDLFYVTSNSHSITDNKVHRQYASCSLCREFANIHCVNCDGNRTWLCIDHWRVHRLNHI